MSLESVGGMGFTKVLLDDTRPEWCDPGHHYQTYFELKGEALLITVRITKPSGRSYDTQTVVKLDALEAVLDALDVQTVMAAKFPH